MLPEGLCAAGFGAKWRDTILCLDGCCGVGVGSCLVVYWNDFLLMLRSMGTLAEVKGHQLGVKALIYIYYPAIASCLFLTLFKSS